MEPGSSAMNGGGGIQARAAPFPEACPLPIEERIRMKQDKFDTLIELLMLSGVLAVVLALACFAGNW